MIIVNSNLYDGYDPNQAYQVGPVIPFQDNETRSGKYNITYRILATQWRLKQYSTTGPNGSYLVSQGQPRHCGAGEVEWTETYALIPPSRRVCESITFPLQTILNGDVIEIPLTTGAQVLYEYFYDPGASVQPIRAYRLVKIGNAIYYYGNKMTGGNVVAADSRVRVWGGFITERATPYTTISQIVQNTS